MTERKITMSIRISPLALYLDANNPRFVTITKRTQENIREYLLKYEDVYQLVLNINNYGSLLPGERIVVIQENGKYVVIEGNRRTCALQFLLERDLVPDDFSHRIPSASDKLIANCKEIEVDVIQDKETALELMTKRHIGGVKPWRPLAKKQFFATNYNDGNGRSIENLSIVTGIKNNEIKEDIRDYKFFIRTYNNYRSTHPRFNKDITVLKTEPFWRMFKVKFELDGQTYSPVKFLKISYSKNFDTNTKLNSELFNKITELIFEKSIVTEEVDTRDTLINVNGILPLLRSILDEPSVISVKETSTTNLSNDNDPIENNNAQTIRNNDTTNGNNISNCAPRGPRSGGPPPRSFFETISWHGKLSRSTSDHQGLLSAIHELHNLSKKTCDRQKAYEIFPIATGMVLRTVYEQALIFRLKQVGLWNKLLQTLRNNEPFPSLKNIETFIESNIKETFSKELIRIYKRVINNKQRELLNALVHSPGEIKLTSASREAIAAGGMYALIQGIIDLSGETL